MRKSKSFKGRQLEAIKLWQSGDKKKKEQAQAAWNSLDADRKAYQESKGRKA